jgi:periplasmic copper chaperone A
VTIENGGADPDRLDAVLSTVSRDAEIHVIVIDQDFVTDSSLKAVTLPPRTRLEMKPGGAHVALLHLDQPLRPGSWYPLILSSDGRVRPA